LLGNGIQESWTYGADASQATYNAGSVYNFGISSVVGGTYVLSANDAVNGNWNYGYDNFGRLVSSGCSGACPYGESAISYTYGYDVQGNRWNQTLTSQGSGDNITHSFGSWNHISDGSVSYDSAGEITNDSVYTYTYDAEGNLTQVNAGGAVYVYDAFGRRVSQTNSSGTYEYLFDLQNHPITKLQSGSRVGGEVWFGRHFASNAGTEDNFMHSDWLGAGRVWTDLSGNVTLDCQMLPFGDSLYCWGSGNNFDDIFASLKYNFDNSLYDSQSRQYNPLQGRWTIPDPSGLAAVDPTTPQTWNRYAYVANNPLSYVDPTGHNLYDCFWSGGCNGNMETGGGTSGIGAGTSNYGGGFSPGLGVVTGLSNQAAQSEEAYLGSGTIPWYQVSYTGNSFTGTGGDLMLLTGTSLTSEPNPLWGGWDPFDAGEFIFTQVADWTDLGPFQFGISSYSSALQSMLASTPIVSILPTNVGLPASTPKPTRPVSLGACMMASLVGHTATDPDVTLGVGVVNVGAYVQFFGPEAVAALLPGPGWLYVATAALVDAGYLGVAYSDCKH
jgi:RHS repeat-associated protein